MKSKAKFTNKGASAIPTGLSPTFIDDPRPLSELLREFMEHNNYSFEEAGRALGMSRSAFYARLVAKPVENLGNRSKRSLNDERQVRAILTLVNEGRA